MHFLAIMAFFLFPACAAGAQEPQAPFTAVVIDNVVGSDELTGASTFKLSNGGTVHLRRLGDHIYVALQSPTEGFANVCVANDRKVRILHASAALGDAEYERVDGTWLKRTSFEWALRDSPRLAPPTEADRSGHLAERGWLGKAGFQPALVREFLILPIAGDRYLAVAFVQTSRDNAVAFAPEGAQDDCTRGTVGVTGLPDTASFTPSTWLQVDRIGR